ncbi:MAG TPA: hypothetical protein VMA13_03135 [Candidatus Saccharimonadales bacterium]|nr:hypothetical protein [Candidatus Saccharimonadales bacterium]
MGNWLRDSVGKKLASHSTQLKKIPRSLTNREVVGASALIQALKSLLNLAAGLAAPTAK